jgi:hypothetical protein
MTSQPQPAIPGPVEWFRAWLVRFMMDVGGRVSWGGITRQGCILFFRRLSENKSRFFRIATAIRDGTYRPRRGSSAPRPGNRRPRPPESIPQKFGWAADLLPKDEAPFRSSLVRLFQDKEMIALLDGAPVALIRPLRSICWMFKHHPPPILALPRKPKAPRPEPPQAAPAPASAQAAPPEPPPPQPPGRATSTPRPKPPPPPARASPTPA